MSVCEERREWAIFLSSCSEEDVVVGERREAGEGGGGGESERGDLSLFGCMGRPVRENSKGENEDDRERSGGGGKRPT